MALRLTVDVSTSHALYVCPPWQKRIALARFLLRHLRQAKKKKEHRSLVKKNNIEKNRQMAQIATAATRSSGGGGFNAEAMRCLIRDELRRGVDDALNKAMPEIAKMVVIEQRKAEKGENSFKVASTPESGAFGRMRRRPSGHGLLADLKDLWA